MKLRNCLLAMLWPVMNCYAQIEPAQRALAIGDTLPDLLLQRVINYPDSSIQLKSIKAKLILIDFWSAGCTPCFRVLPGMDSLQSSYKDLRIITVTRDDEPARINRLFQHIPGLSDIHLPIIIKDSILHDYFPHLLISHVVWLDSSRRVIAMTGTDYVTAHYIDEALKGKTFKWPVKQDVFDFDYTKPLLIPNPTVTVARSFSFFSAFTANMEGIAPPTQILRDSANGVTRFSFYNLELLTYCQLAVDFTVVFRPEQFSLKLINPERFFKPAWMALSDWSRDNTFCYSTVLPLDISIEALSKTVQQDLLRWLELLHVRLVPLKKNKNSPVRYEILENSY